jgi:hypothetical protein
MNLFAKIEHDENRRAVRLLSAVTAPAKQIIESLDAVADDHNRSRRHDLAVEYD